MGHSAKCGAYTVLNALLGTLVHFELLQVINIYIYVYFSVLFSSQIIPISTIFFKKSFKFTDQFLLGCKS